MYIDSHCHLDCIDLADFEGSFDVLMNSIGAAHVDRMLCVSIDTERFTGMCNLVKAYPQVDLSVGVHPSHVLEHPIDQAGLVALADDPRIVALGETGLDYFYAKDSKQAQQQSFREHLRAANQISKPVIVHTRDAQQDTLDILRQEKVENCGGVMHCFTESWEMAEQALDMGMYISFSGIVTFRNADALREVASKVPEDRFLIETDAPYLAPVPHRGKQNYPAWVSHVAECLAVVRGCDQDTIAHQSTQN